MLTSLALIFLVGLCMAAIWQKLKLPRIIGMLVTGMVLGPYVLDFLDSSVCFIRCPRYDMTCTKSLRYINSLLYHLCIHRQRIYDH